MGDDETLRVRTDAAGYGATSEQRADFSEEIGAGPFVAPDLVEAGAGGELIRRSARGTNH